MQCNRVNDFPLGHERGYGTINNQRIKRDIIVIGASAGGWWACCSPAAAKTESAA